MQSEVYQVDEDVRDGFGQYRTEKVTAVKAMQEQTIETKARKIHRGIGVENGRYRVCN